MLAGAHTLARRSFRLGFSFLLTIPLLLGAVHQNALARGLTLEERIHAQEAIERVYWEHRIWPAGNPAPKPALEQVLPRAQMRARVIDYLKKSNALAMWGRPITGQDLQAEMQRMARESQAPDVLRELFAALGDDPFTIAETLARQTLAEPLIREAYAGDARAGDARADGRSFDAWWSEARSSIGEAIVPVPQTYEAVEIGPAAACVADSWRAIPSGPAPFVGHKAVWTGAEMIIWGQYSTGYPATGGRYSPATNSWTATPDLNAPITRYAHTAVWTGTEMIVWGGHLNGVAYPAGYLDTGGRYSPITNSWASMASSGAPSPRESHTAVWTGSEMIIWGGDTGEGTVGTGARYDPGSDTWTSTSDVNVPQTRALHSAVWTGSRMIVWGGDNSSDGRGYVAIRTGGQYDPSTDTWSPTSILSAPGSRSRHVAVWTGSQMIVWGGGPLYTNTGGIYDPLLNTWTPTSMSGALPDGRESHAAVWTGREMIIWGGHQGGQPFNSHGGRYDPALATWIPMSALGAPIGREGCTAVWTGNEMLVWRGAGGTSDGYSGRYCSSACVAPVAEVCNGVDDDCDGVVDDDARPKGVPALMVSGTSGSNTLLSWSTPADSSAYDVVSGKLSVLAGSGGDYALATDACLENDSNASSMTFAGVPAIGDGFWFLVRGVNGCGPGTYDDSGGQSNSRDPGINASALSCP